MTSTPEDFGSGDPNGGNGENYDWTEVPADFGGPLYPELERMADEYLEQIQSEVSSEYPDAGVELVGEAPSENFSLSDVRNAWELRQQLGRRLDILNAGSVDEDFSRALEEASTETSLLEIIIDRAKENRVRRGETTLARDMKIKIEELPPAWEEIKREMAQSKQAAAAAKIAKTHRIDPRGVDALKETDPQRLIALAKMLESPLAEGYSNYLKKASDRPPSVLEYVEARLQEIIGKYHKEEAAILAGNPEAIRRLELDPRFRSIVKELNLLSRTPQADKKAIQEAGRQLKENNPRGALGNFYLRHMPGGSTRLESDPTSDVLRLEVERPRGELEGRSWHELHEDIDRFLEEQRPEDEEAEAYTAKITERVEAVVRGRVPDEEQELELARLAFPIFVRCVRAGWPADGVRQ